MYKIMTDNMADLPKEYFDEHDIGMITLPFGIDGQMYDNVDDVDVKDFYALMREGKETKTSQPSPGLFKEYMEEYLSQGYDGVLCLCISSGISGTYNSALNGRELLLEENPDANVIIVDSLCASLGEGLFVHKAVQNRDNGMSMEENAKWLEENKLNFVHAFTVDDLVYLYRGGRVKKSAAVLGTIINIKPALHVDNEGKLINLAKVKGRRKSLNWLVDYMGDHIKGYEDKNETIFISHADCIEDAQYVADRIKERFGYESFMINYIGPAIGAHAGPGTVALFFLGNER